MRLFAYNEMAHLLDEERLREEIGAARSRQYKLLFIPVISTMEPQNKHQFTSNFIHFI